ncbi:alpha/beta fold hydrolase [Streptomyces sp. NPDC050548]|uniref:alpha/beta fold hydrolase n=1 Tax=Streptomyces sp. NPDC050548 TaxID=3365629 RepID=UPI0037B5F50B
MCRRAVRGCGRDPFVDVEQDAYGAVAVGVGADPPAAADHGLDRLGQCVGIPGQDAGEGVVAGVGLFGGPGFEPAVEGELHAPHPQPRIGAVAPVLHGVEQVLDPAQGDPVPPILPPRDGFLFLDRDKFAASFAADVPEDLAAFMADSQVPWGLAALGGVVTEAAWQTKPSWYLVATDDRMIPPTAQRAMAERAGATVTETPGSHAVHVSNPAAVAAVIRQAARTLSGS